MTGRDVPGHATMGESTLAGSFKDPYDLVLVSDGVVVIDLKSRTVDLSLPETV